MKNNLAEIVLQNIEFLSLSPGTEVHPDAAVRQLEIAASLIKDLPEPERNSFFEQAARRLETLRREGASKEHLDLLENLREHLGL